MFATVVVPHTSKMSDRLLGCFSLVSDNMYKAIFYVNSYWSFEDSKRRFVASGIPEDIAEKLLIEKLGPKPKQNNSPILGYLREDWENSRFHSVDTELVLSHDELYHRAILVERGVNANTVLLCLAAAGIDIVLPSTTFSKWDGEEINKLKEDLAEERYLYLEALSSTAAQAMEALKNEELRDIYRWAQNNAVLRIAPLAKRIEKAASKGNQNLLTKAGYNLITEGTPAIGGAAAAGGLPGAGLALGIEAFKSLISTLKGQHKDAAHPEITYLLKIKSSIGDIEKSG